VPDQPLSEFLKQNLILIGVVFLVIFAYLVLLIRKRWKRGFLHTPPDNKDGV
jgi:hypothetical protein